MRLSHPIIALLASLLLAIPASAGAALPITLCESVWLDPARERSIPVRIRMPGGDGKVGVILFSHGLGGSLDAGTLWAHAWAEAGFAVINLQHPGSDSAIFGKPGFRTALGFQQLIARARDVHFAIDELSRKVVEGQCDLSRIDRTRIGIAGHSFGAQTVQAVAGQTLAFEAERPLFDVRVRAAVALSPSPPLLGSPEEAFATIRMPFLSITGTKDEVPAVIPITARQRQEPFHYMAPGDKYLLVLSGATHEMLAGQVAQTSLKDEPTSHIRNTIIATTVAFWRSTLDSDQRSLRWLQSPEGLRAGLPVADLFESR